VNAIIFDLFNTLTCPLSDTAGVPYSADILGVSRSAWATALTQLSGPRLTGELKSGPDIVRHMATALKVAAREDTLLSAAAAHERLFAEILTSVPEKNVALLRSLRAEGFRLAVLSNCDACELTAWKACPLHGLFDVELFSCQVGLVKPQPEFYVECLRQLGVEAKSCLFVGDGGHDELAGARAVGMRTVLFSGVIRDTWPERIPELRKYADFHIESLDAVVGIAAQLGRKSTDARENRT
jgi:putative hydrolase of the HAD superfamily